MKSGMHACKSCGRLMMPSEMEGICPACFWEGLFAAEEGEVTGLTPEPKASLLRLPGYEVLEEIARGGMGIVYRARQLEPRRTVALKMLLPHRGGMADMSERFQIEVRALTELEHPAILPVHQTGEHDGLPFFTMKLATGGTLASQMDKFAGNWRKIAKLMATLADAIQFAHERGILHRDLKPGNILFDEQDRPYVSDFGLAKLISVDSQLTQSTDFLGTPHYVAPEVAARSARQATTASDIYSLGAILYELLAGRPPFEAEGVASLLRKIVEEEPKRPSTRISNEETAKTEIQGPRSEANLKGEAQTAHRAGDVVWKSELTIPRDLEVICLKCLAKEPGRRYGTARDLAADLTSFIEGKTITARQSSSRERLWSWCRRRPALAGLTVALALTALVGFAGVLSQWRRAERNAGSSRRNLYDAEINLAGQALAVNNLDRARALLDRQRPQRGESDLRGWEWYFFEGEARDLSTASLPRARQAFERISLSPDGQSMAIPGAATNQVEIWDTASRQVRSRLPLNSTWVRYSNQGGYLAAGSIGHLLVWDFQSNSVRLDLAIEENLNDAVFSPDDAFLAATSHQPSSKLRLWSVADGKLLQERDISGPPRPDCMALAFSPDGRTLVMSGTKGTLYFFGLPELLEEKTFPVHDDSILALAISPDGRWLAAGSGYSDETVRIWDLTDGMRLYSLRGNSSFSGSLCFTRDSKWLITGSNDQTARVWDLQKMMLLRTLRGHSSGVTSVGVSPDGRSLMTGSGVGEVKLWDLEHNNNTAGNRITLPRLMWPVVSHNHRFFAGVDINGQLIYGATAAPDNAAPITKLGANLVRTGISADGGLVVASEKDGTLRLWHRDQGTVQATNAHSGGVHHLVFVERKPALVSVGSSDHRVKIWSTDLALRHTWQLPTECWLWGANVVPELNLFVADGHGIARRVFDLVDGHLVATLNSDVTALTGLASSPNGHILAMSDDTGSVDLWDTNSWKLRARLRGHRTGVGSVAFSPDGRRLASGGGGSEAVKLWDMETLQQLCDLPVQSDYTTYMNFSSDGRSLTFNPTLNLHRSLQVLHGR